VDQLWLIVGFVVKLAIACAVGAGCVAGWRWSMAVCRPLGLVVGLGIVIRAWAGLGMFLISYLNLPLLASQHAGDGFWLLAPDARVYYNVAATAAYGAAIPAGSPSPAFLEVFGFWLRATGRVPSSAVLFNLALYVASSVLLISAFRPLTSTAAKRGALITLSALTFSPVLIMLGTQALKDVFSAFLIIVIAVGLTSLVRSESGNLLGWRPWCKVAAVAVALFLMAGIRAYYALFLWAAVAVALALRTLTSPRALMLRWAAFATVMPAVLWLAFMFGAGPYYTFYGNLVTRTIGASLPVISPSKADVAALPPSEATGFEAAATSVVSFREGFIRTGGATNITPKPSTGAKRDPGEGEPEPSRAARLMRELGIGLAALLVPISVLKLLGIVEFSGGRGFLFVTDLDTFFVDVALLAVLWMLVTSRRPGRRDAPVMLFALSLGVVSGLLMAYVVTNYGTLFRLRLLATIPLWLVPLALNRVSFTARAVENTPAEVDWTPTVTGSPHGSAVESKGAV
jgi:hypothetical protein